MKKVVVLIVVFIGLTVNAQKKSGFEKDTYKLVEIISNPTFEPIINQFSSIIKEDKLKDFRKDVNKTFPELYTALAKIYMEEYTHEEVKKLLQFYKTDLGKKVAKNSVILAQKGMVAGQKWGKKLQEVIAKYQ